MKKDYLKIFYQNLRELIKEKNISISQLARQTKIPRTSISNWVNSRSVPRIKWLTSLAQFFNCSTDYLLGLEDIFGNKIP